MNAALVVQRNTHADGTMCNKNCVGKCRRVACDVLLLILSVIAVFFLAAGIGLALLGTSGSPSAFIVAGVLMCTISVLCETGRRLRRCHRIITEHRDAGTDTSMFQTTNLASQNLGFSLESENSLQ